MSTLTRYAKAVVAVAGAVSTWAATYFPGDPTVGKWAGLAAGVATAVAVWAVPNTPAAPDPTAEV